MAYLEIGGDKCPNCGSTATTEISKPTDSFEQRREIFLKCYECGKETSYGEYKLVGRALIKV